MKADILDLIALTNASLRSSLCFIEELSNADTKITRRSLKNIVDFLKIIALEQATKSPQEYRDNFVNMVNQINSTTSSARSGSKSKSLLRLTNGSTTRKNMTGGTGFQLSRFKKQPTKLNKAIVLTRKAGEAAASTFNSTLDFLRVDQQTRNYLRRLGKIQERALERGNLNKADEIQVRIREIREVYDLFPEAHPLAVVALILYCIYKTPAWSYATARTGAGISVSITTATAAATGGKIADIAASGISKVGGMAAAAASAAASAASYVAPSYVAGTPFSNPLDFGPTDMAMDWANSTGRETNRLIGGIIDASINPSAVEFGHMIGFFVFTPLLLFATKKWNASISKDRHEATQRRLASQKRLGDMLDEKEKKLLKNVKDDNVQDNTEIETEMKTILTYFGLTEEEKEKNLQGLQEVVKAKYQERILREHPNRGGRAENFDRTKQMYNNFKDLIIRLS
jgi:hypothetical protein